MIKYKLEILKMNKIFKYNLIILFLLITGNCFAQQEAEKTPIDPEVRIGTLSNGLTYYIRHNDKPKERANFYLAQKVGSILEEDNQRGLAHFLEHMAFNGTKNFPDNTMISELEKKGIKFGANINAYTSYDETIYYMSNIPIDQKGVIDTALLVLHDWSGFITLDGNAIDDERGVIREEWRTSNSGNLRMLNNEILPTIYKGSLYANRMPIGTMEIVDNFKYKELRDYYKKWYRPDLQGIVIVGDIDVDEIETKIKQLFSDIPTPVNPAKRDYIEVPDNNDPIIAIASDPELTSTSLEVYWKMDAIPKELKSTSQYTKSVIIGQLISGMLNNRFSEITRESDPPFVYASAGKESFFITPVKDAWTINAGPVNNNIEAALKAILIENDRMKAFGFSQAELDRVKKGLLRSLNDAYIDKDNRTNGSFGNDLMSHFIHNYPIPSVEWEYNNKKKFVTEISIDTINYWADQYVSDTNMVIVIKAIEEKGKKLPVKQDIINVLKDVKNLELDPYIYKEVNKVLMESKPLPGKVVATAPKPFGYTEWTLSNGLNVRFKDTDYEEDQVIVYGFSPGGFSLIKDEDLPSAIAASKIMDRVGLKDFSASELGKMLVGKNVNVSKYVKDNYEMISGQSAIKDIETFFQLIYLKMTSPSKDQLVFENWLESSKGFAKDRLAEPGRVFQDTLNAIKTNYHIRAREFYDLEVLDEVDYDKGFQLAKERFADASDFTFFITGNIDKEQVKSLVEIYFGSLPSTCSNEKMVNHNIQPPKGFIKKHFTHPMETPKSMISINYTGDNIPDTEETRIKGEILGSILSTIYLEKIREELGGAYNISARYGTKPFPVAHYTFNIGFNTDPDPIKKAKLIGIVYDEIEKMKKQGPTQESINKVREYILKRHKERISEKNAIYWNQAATTLFQYGVDQLTNYEFFVNSITPAMISKFANEVFKDDIIEVIMDPETITKN
jgi:zinc protease